MYYKGTKKYTGILKVHSNNDCLFSFCIFENNSDKQINKIENINLSTKILRIEKQTKKQQQQKNWVT